MDYEWEPYKGPGGCWQWRVKGGNGPKAPMAHGEGEQDVMMLTTDVALKVDSKYRKYVEEFAADEAAFAKEFARVWYKLVNRDMGPVTRLVGPDVAPPQDWQFPLPHPPSKLADMKQVEKDLGELMDKNPDSVMEFVRLARNSANTYRHTDYLGGCNGARIRFKLDWPINHDLDKVLDMLAPIQAKYGKGLSWADLIVLAGNVAAKKRGAPKDLPFCPGRTDDDNGDAWDTLEYVNSKIPESIEEVDDRVRLCGLTPREFVATALPNYPTVKDLQKMMESPYDQEGEDIWTQTLKYSPHYKREVENFIAEGDEVYKREFAKAWTKHMNADRFDGPIYRKTCPACKCQECNCVECRCGESKSESK